MDITDNFTVGSFFKEQVSNWKVKVLVVVGLIVVLGLIGNYLN